MFDYILHGAIIFFSFIALAQMIGSGYSYGKNKDWQEQLYIGALIIFIIIASLAIFYAIGVIFKLSLPQQ
jgi:hypothetical protein